MIEVHARKASHAERNFMAGFWYKKKSRGTITQLHILRHHGHHNRFPIEHSNRKNTLMSILDPFQIFLPSTSNHESKKKHHLFTPGLASITRGVRGHRQKTRKNSVKLGKKGKNRLNIKEKAENFQQWRNQLKRGTLTPLHYRRFYGLSLLWDTHFKLSCECNKIVTDILGKIFCWNGKVRYKHKIQDFIHIWNQSNDTFMKEIIHPK